MASHKIPKLSLFEFATFVTTGATNVVRFFWNVAKFSRHKLSGVWPLSRVFLIAFVRSNGYTIRQSQYLSKTTGDQTRAYCAKEKLPCTSVSLDCGDKFPNATLHMIDISKPKGADSKVMLYFHGGGYVFPIIADVQVALASRLAREAGIDQVGILEYAVAPGLKYPGQLAQAVASLRYVLKDRGILPGNVVISGDSAGGNLAMSLLAHIQKPHPAVPAFEELAPGGEKRLRALALFSPWAGMSYKAASYDENGGTDFITREKMLEMNDALEPTLDPWISMADSQPEFWVGLPVDEIFMTAGSWEIFRDDIYKLDEILRAAGVKVILAKGEAEVHVIAVVETVLSIPNNGTSAQALKFISTLWK